MTPELMEEAVVDLAILSGYLLVMGFGCLIADFVFPHIPFIERYLESLPNWDEEEDEPMIIRNKYDLRLAYELLNEYKEFGWEDQQKTVDLKKKIRLYLRKSCSETIIRDHGIDGYIILLQLPEFLDDESMEDAIEWFKSECYIRPTYSAYDCTGRPFTNWYKVFRRLGHWFAYHSVAFDV